MANTARAVGLRPTMKHNPPLTFIAYERAAFETWQPESIKVRHLLDEPILNAALGIGGEAGEVLDLIKKMYFPSKKSDETIDWDLRLTDELGDLLYYVAIISKLLGIPLETIAHHNTTKLAARHKVSS